MLVSSSPNSQAHDTTVPSASVLRSSKVQFERGADHREVRRRRAGRGNRTGVTVRVRLPSSPPSSVTVRVTLTAPAAAKVWLGFFWVEVPSLPNCQAYDMTSPSLSVLRSVNVQLRSVQELLKSAVGAAFSGSGPVESSPQAATTSAAARINPIERQ